MGTFTGTLGTKFSFVAVPEPVPDIKPSYTGFMIRFFIFMLFSTLLSAQVIPPPFTSVNRQRVANNLNTLFLQGQLPPGLGGVLATLSGFSNAAKNAALDQLHPAMYSALFEMQTEIGGQILSVFHRRPSAGWVWHDWRVWIDPMGTWLKEGSHGGQVGFNSATRGCAAGIDRKIGERWSFGGGLVWNHSDIRWHSGRGTGMVNRYLGVLYSDFKMESFYSGVSLYGGCEHNHIVRNILFDHVSAHGEFNSLDFAGQFSAAYLFDVPYFFLYPYAICDFLYFWEPGFSETGAGPLNLTVKRTTSGTLRVESGMGLQVQDPNYNETVWISPTFAFGWAMECPLFRPAYTVHFAGAPLSFQTKGWNHVWQLFAVQLGLAIYVYDFILSGEYITEMSPRSFDDFWGQRANISLEYSW